MAFHAPQQRPQATRQLSFSQPLATVESSAQAAPLRKRPLDESQEWILFAPDSQASFTSQTSRTANLSRLSGFGSLETEARSGQRDSAQAAADDDDGEDLDSLDDGLHAFNAPSSLRLDQSGGSILPAHDGLGTFPPSFAYVGHETMQDQLWQFERYNPHRRRMSRRQSSVHRRLESTEEEGEKTIDPREERRLMIENWRVEQSKAVVDEIERETRRRQRRMSKLSGTSAAEPSASMDLSRAQQTSAAVKVTQGPAKNETESFWTRITRRVIQELIGLDESTLSVIFGEELPAELSQTPTQTSTLTDPPPTSSITAHPDRAWERRLLERVARELGVLVNDLCEIEGAFSTYARTEAVPLSHGNVSSVPAATVWDGRRRHRIPSDPSAPSDTLFDPTLPQATLATDASLWGIEEEPTPSQPAEIAAGKKGQTQTAEYWEQELDIGMIFTYLRNRFSSRPSSPGVEARQASPRQASGPLPANWATSANTASALGTSPESLRRADLIRRHHPLVSHAAERRREGLLRRAHNATLHRQRQGGSSCASQSTKRSRVSSGSRRYWDLGGSGAPGSVVSVGSGREGALMGSWGEA